MRFYSETLQKVCGMKLKREFKILIVFVATVAFCCFAKYNKTRPRENCGKKDAKDVGVELVLSCDQSDQYARSFSWLALFQSVKDNQVFSGKI